MSDALDDLELNDDDKQRQPLSPRIAPPNVASGVLPPTNLRGLPPPATSEATPATGSTADLENHVATRVIPPPIAKPSPLETRTTADQAELGRLRTTGSGISQVARAHPIAGGILRGLNIAGSVASGIIPGLHPLLNSIPGTEEHHNYLERQATGKIGEDLGEQEKELANTKTEADTDEANARGDQAAAEADKARAETAAAGQPKPKEEKWTVSQEWVDAADGTPVKIEENSGQVVRATDGKPPTGVKPVAPKQERPDTPEQQYLDEYMKKHPGATVADAVKAYNADTQKPERLPKQLAVTPDGKVIELTPGVTVPEGTQSVGGLEKGATAAQAGKDALAYANDYLAKGKFTGAGDEALMEKYFEIAKPSSGFRMTQPQIEMLTKAQDAVNSVIAKGKHLFTPEAPYFSDELRKSIVDTMNEVVSTKGQGNKPGAGGEKENPLVVKAPNGKSYPFKDQASADAFRKAAGIK